MVAEKISQVEEQIVELLNSVDHQQALKVIERVRKRLGHKDVSLSKNGTYPLTDEQLMSLKQVYTLDEPDDILHVIQSEDEMLSLLNDAEKVIRDIFPNIVRFELRRAYEFSDPLKDDLVFIVILDDTVEQAMEYEDKFDRNWWLSNHNRANGRLIITLDFA